MKPLLAVAAICLLGACLYPRSPHDLVFTARGEGHSVRLDEGRAYGPDIEVDRFEDGYRGVWNGRTIDVRVAGDRVQGSLGSMPVDLHFEEANGVLAVKGLVGGRLGTIKLAPTSLTGQVAGCGYDLRRQEIGRQSYRGYRCNAADTTLTLPQDWASLPLHERATFLALMLAS